MPTQESSITRLPFRLPEWAPRVTWVSPRAREVWEGRIQAISQAWQDAEIQSVVRGARDCGLITTTRSALLNLSRLVEYRPLADVPLADGYTSASRPPNPREPMGIRAVISHSALLADSFADAYKHGGNYRQAELLGYPKCCTDFFERVWVKERWMDTTWPYVTNAFGNTGKDASVFLRAVRERQINMLWRYLGIRPVFHLPCSPACEESQQIEKRLVGLLPEEERRWMMDILAWPVEWTALHGIGEIRTPILRACFATDATAGKLTVRWEGTRYPEEGATGTSFPLQKPSEVKVEPLPIIPFRGRHFVFDPKGSGRVTTPTSAAYDELAKVPRETYAALEKRMIAARNNGFQSLERMRAAHTVILDFLRDLSPVKMWGRVVDLGCGDGTLLSQIPAVQRIGVNSSTLIPRSGFQYVGANIRTWLTTVNIPVDLYFCALERFEEDPGLRDLLKGRRVLVYSYAPDGFASRLGAIFPLTPGLVIDCDPACHLTLFDPVQ